MSPDRPEDGYYYHETEEGPCWHRVGTCVPDDRAKHGRHLLRQLEYATSLEGVLRSKCEWMEARPYLPQGFQLKLNRRCDGETARVANGLIGEVLYHGDEGDPSIVFVTVGDARRWLNRKAEVGHE